MNKIDELIEKLCPSGVPYINLQAVAEIGTGSSDRKESIENGVYPFYVRSKDILKINKYEFDEIAIVIPGEGRIGEIFHYVVGKYALHQRAYRIHVIDNRLNTKYLYYYMSSMFKDFIMKKAVTATVTSIRKPMIEAFPVPVPPLEIQREIVYILDKFTALLAELKAELKARKKQYAYYRDKLFEFDDEKKVPLSAICEIKRGGNFQKKDFVDTGISAIHYGKIYTYYGLYTDKTLNFITEDVAKKQKFAKPNDIVMAVTSENIEDVCKCVVWEGKEPVAVSGHSIIISHNQNARYLAYYFTSSHFQSQKEKCCFGTKVIEIKLEHFSKILVPIPNIEEQNRIVKILDKFYTITNSLSEGIPAEIEARQKQYEYYRDKLLTFKELGSNE